MLTVLDDLFRNSTGPMLAVYLVVTAAIAAGIVYTVRSLVRVYMKYRGTRIVTCPETQQHAAVKVNAGHAAATCLFGDPEVRLESCSRWPERRRCPQDCILELESTPDGCRLRNMLANWYAGKPCAFCHRTFEQIYWLDPKPALLSPEGKVVEWEAIHPESIPDALGTHQPVCTECKVVEPFRAEHTDLVTERPWKR